MGNAFHDPLVCSFTELNVYLFLASISYIDYFSLLNSSFYFRDSFKNTQSLLVYFGICNIGIVSRRV